MTLLATTDPSAMWESLVADPARFLWAETIRILPLVLGALLVFLAWYVAALILRATTRKLLGISRIEAAIRGTKLDRILRALGEDVTPAGVIAAIVYYAVLLAGLAAAADVLELRAVRDILKSIAAFLPSVLSAMLALGLGAWLAAVVARAVGGLAREAGSPFAQILERATEFLLLVVVVTVALDLLGANLAILRANLTILLGSAFVTLAFLAAWSMRRPAEHIVANYYVRRLLSVGDSVEVSGTRGVVHRFAPLGFVLRTQDGREVLVLAKDFLGQASWKAS